MYKVWDPDAISWGITTLGRRASGNRHTKVKKLCKIIRDFMTIRKLGNRISFTVMCLVTWPLNESEVGVDLVMIQTSLLFLC